MTGWGNLQRVRQLSKFVGFGWGGAVRIVLQVMRLSQKCVSGVSWSGYGCAMVRDKDDMEKANIVRSCHAIAAPL